MSAFASRDSNKFKEAAKTGLGGGNYFSLPGEYECQIVGWKTLPKRNSSVVALVADYKILNNVPEGHETGSIRNSYMADDDDMFDKKVTNLLVAASGYSTGLDEQLIDKEDWFSVLNASVKPPSIFLNKKIIVSVTYDFRAIGRKQLKKKPELASDPDFIKENQFSKVVFNCHDETRAQTQALLAKAKK